MPKVSKQPSPKKSKGIFEMRLLDWKAIKDMDDNPRNWKKHTVRQQRAVAASIDAGGWAKPLIFNVTTKRFIDGHGRKKIVIEKKLTNVPVCFGRWDEKTEARMLRDLDPLGAMYEVDSAALNSLNEYVKKHAAKMEGLRHESQVALKQVQNDMEDLQERMEKSESKTLIPKSKKRARLKRKVEDDEELSDATVRGTSGDDGSSTSIKRTEYEDDVTFPSSNPYGLPDLLPDLLASPDCIPKGTFDKTPGSNRDTSFYCHSVRPLKVEKPSGGVTGFFTEDWRFEHVFNDSAEFLERLIGEDWSAIVEPDFSTYDDWPFAVRLYQVYKARWCCRYWQEAGLTVIPHIRYTSFPTKDGNWLYGTLPECPVVTFQTRGIQREEKKVWKKIAKCLTTARDYVSFKHVIMYGETSHRKYLDGLLPSGVKYHWIEPFTTVRRKKLKNGNDR